MDVFHRLLDTTPINLAQFGWALVPALALLVLWELGKLVLRGVTARSRTALGGAPAAPQPPAPRSEASVPVARASS